MNCSDRNQKGSHEMKTATILIGALLAAGTPETIGFDKGDVGEPPSGWTATQTGSGQAKWAIVQDDTAPSKPNVLKQSGQATYPVCLKDDTSLKDGFVEMKFKALSGKEDQAGGVVWRARDANNYYVARANALENNVSLYYTQNGRRNTIKYVDAPVAKNRWHTLRADFVGKRIQVRLDGTRYIDIEDDRIAGAGGVGVWTKADSVTAFDDFMFGASK
jgi:hypothetical protein